MNDNGVFFSQALGTAINSTKVMTAQQVVKTDDGGEVRDITSIVYIKLMYVRPRTCQLMDQ